MIGIIEIGMSIRLPVFVLLIATVVLGSGAYKGNDGSGGSLAYRGRAGSAYAAADAWQPFPGSGSHDGHKGIRSYDNDGSNRPNADGNRRNAGCSKCKWEDDDYWEKGWEDEAEPDDKEDGDDCYDDGQYRGHDHGHHGNKGSPPGVQKLGAPNPSGASGVGTLGGPPVKQGDSGQQPGPGWTAGAPGIPSKPTWNQGFDDGAGSQPFGNLPNVGAARPADAGGSKTGSECSGGYQRGTGCAQGSGGVGPVKQLPFVGLNPANVQKEAPSDYAGGPTAVYNPRGSPTVGGCSNSPYDTSCADKSVDGTRPRDSSVVPSYGPSVEHGQHPAGGSPQTSPFGSLYDSSASQGQRPGSGSPQSSPFGPSGQRQRPGSGAPQGSPFGPSGQGQHPGNGGPQSSPFGPLNQGQYPGSGSPQSSPFGPPGQEQHPGSGSPQGSPFGPSGQGQRPGSGAPQRSPFGPSDQGQHPGSGAPQGSPFGSSGQGQYPGSGTPQKSPFGPSSQGQRPGSGSPQRSPFGPSDQGQHPGSGAPQGSPFGSSGQGQRPDSGAPKENSGFGTGPYREFPGSTRPGNPPNFNAVANAVSSSVAYASTGSGVGHPTSGPSTPTYSSGPLLGSPGFSGGNVPYGSHKPSHTNVKGRPLDTTPKFDASKDGESKIFYIDVKPAPGSPVGVRPRTTTSAPYSVVKTTPVQQPSFYNPPGSTKPPYQPTPYSGPGITKPSYQPTPYDGPATTKPAPYNDPGITKPYQPSSYSGPGTTQPFYQSPPYDGPGITKSSHQPAPYGRPGTTKVLHQPTPYGGPYGDLGTTKPSYQPAPYDGSGITRPSYQPTPYSGPSTVKPSYQPAPYDGSGVTRPSYQPTPYSGPSTVKPSYQPAPYSGPTTTKPFYQPVPYDGPGIKKPSYQPAPYGGPGTIKPSYQPGGTETTKSPYQFLPKDTNVGCTRGAEDCGAARGCSGGTNLNGSPDYKPCGQPGLPVGVNKTSGPVGGFQAYPTDFSQNPQQNIPGAIQPFDGFPVGVGSGSRDCTSGTSSDCTSGSIRPAYVDNKIPGEGGSYSSNPFLNGKIPNLIGMTHGGQFAATTTSKPIGLGNPFLQPGIAGAFAGAAAWSNVGSGAASNPAGESVVSIGGETTKPIGKDNPFLGESGHGRGDIEIDNPPDPTPGGSASWSPGNDLANTGLGQTNVNPFLGDKIPQGSVRPSDRYPGSSWSSGPIDDASSSAMKSPSAAPRGSGSGGGVGIGLGGFASDKLGQTGHDGGGSFPGAFSGAFSSSQSSSNSGAGATNPIFGQANDGSWASSGANAASQAGSGAWSSSGASAYAASSANSWAGSQPSFVKG
ncbi:collagen alpha-1(I) chain-like isoform X2 [Frieseomelitta varia]|uniref:collagen alpha-1(I) chain-like isoform X2 n=1 Tax=Frieseomelitta varia TaxID=561572 RepID=UPI001CB6AA22|nr:collagen alpha-1(I) chain-like isoform X2 [Frieseomelitta varia]